jgi:hypothetical protein
MLKAAIDESGTHDGAPCICVAACLGAVSQWKQFCRDWEPRATKYVERGGYHAKMGSTDDNAFLASIIERWLWGMAVTISYDDFKRVPHRLKSKFGAEYVTALRIIAVVLQHYCETNEIRWISWVLEAGHKQQEAADRFLTDLEKNRPDFRVWGHDWVTKAEIITHSADLVAHVAARSYGGERLSLMDVIEKSVLVRHWALADLLESVEGGEQMLKEERWERRKKKEARRNRRSGEPNA